MNIDQIETYIKYLDSQGLDMKPVWAQFREMVEKERLAQPDVLDLQYICPCVPPVISEHIWRGQKQVLSPTNLFKGYSYTLSPGQRQWLRDNYGMTPTETITILDFGVWPGNHPKTITLRSDEHVDPKRRHVLVSATINRPGKFFHEAQQLDLLLEQMRPRVATVTAIVSKHFISVLCESTPLAKVATDITSLQVGDKVTVVWSVKETKIIQFEDGSAIPWSTKSEKLHPEGVVKVTDRIEMWKVTKRLTADWRGVPSSRRTAPGGISLDGLMEELKEQNLL